MKNQLIYLVTGLILSINASSICRSELSDNLLIINDGPYIFNVNHELKIKWIQNNVLHEDLIIPDNFSEIKKKFNLLFSYDDLKRTYPERPEYRQIYSRADSIGVITDVHGEYNTYIRLLKAMGIIDKNLNWIFGKGHLVVLGDTFDRGKMVTEVLWHLFGLEKQAENAGGMVHVLLGNHEFMVLGKDLDYINEKYKKVEIISNTKYFDLYSDSSVLGNWLRSRPVVITINNIIFVHGGLSMEIVQRKLTIDQINEKFLNKIIGKDPELVSNDEELIFLNKGNGPIWYRGYFRDTGFSETRIDSILDFYNKDHIIIGHTPNEGIISLFNSKIFGTDTGIMYKEPGEALLYKNGIFYKVFTTGKRIRL